MEYLVGFLLSAGTIIFAIVIGLNRDRGFFTTVAFIVATFYVLFAVMGAQRRTLMIEILIASGFFLVAALGFKKNLGWWRQHWSATGYLILSAPALSQIPECRSGGQVSAEHLM